MIIFITHGIGNKYNVCDIQCTCTQLYINVHVHVPALERTFSDVPGI